MLSTEKSNFTNCGLRTPLLGSQPGGGPSQQVAQPMVWRGVRGTYTGFTNDAGDPHGLGMFCSANQVISIRSDWDTGMINENSEKTRPTLTYGPLFTP